MPTNQPDARLGRSAYSIYPLPLGSKFHPYADFDHGGEPGLDLAGLELPAPTEQHWLELNRLAPLAEKAGSWVTVTQFGLDLPLRLTTTPKGQQPHEAGLQWCDALKFQAFHRAGHYLRQAMQRAGTSPNAGGASAISITPAEYVAWVEEHLEPWQAWSRLLEWEGASQYPDYCFALRRHLGEEPLERAA